MLTNITIWKCDVMSHLVRSRGKDTVQCTHCAMCIALHGGAHPPPQDATFLERPPETVHVQAKLGCEGQKTYVAKFLFGERMFINVYR